MKLKNKLFAFGFLYFSTLVFSAHAEITKIQISNTTLTRLEGYIDQSFFSIERNNKISNITSLFLFISQDGNYSVISYCADFSEYACNLDHLKFKANKRCERISKQECLQIMDRKNLLKDNKTYEKIIKKNILKHFAIVQSPVAKDQEKKFYSDIAAVLLRDFDQVRYDN
jgi:hypothetical protein